MSKGYCQTWPCCAFAGLAALALASCAANGGPMADQVPGSLGLPAGTPQRPAAVAPYPDVHDLPPARSTPTLSEGDQLRLETDLAAARARQEKLQNPDARQQADKANAANAAAMEKARAAAKVKPAAPQQ